MVQPTNRTAMSKILVIAGAALSLSACSTAQPPADEAAVSPSPALWTLADADTVIHLFGFAPVLKTGTAWETTTITEAFDAAGLVVAEADNTSPEAQAAVQALIPQLGLNTDGATLTAALSETDASELNAISTSLGAPLQALDALKPWLASVQLGVLSVSQGGYDLTNPPSTALLARAKQAGTPVRTLESPTHVMALMAGLPEAEQVGMLMHTARTLRDQPNQQAELADAWLAGDVGTVGALLHGPDGAWSSEAIYDAMLVTRNKMWVSQIKTLLAEHEGTVFLTVGLGHFAGKDSLITLLEADGLSPQRQ